MKKIVALVLALALCFALASCKNGKGGSVNIDEFKNAIAATVLDSAKIEVTQVNDLLPETPLTAVYDIDYEDDGSATVDFTYTLYNELGAENITSTHTGSARIAPDGTVTGDSVGANVTSVASVSFNLDQKKMSSCTASMGILTAKIPAANTASVLGVEIGADVVLTISISGGVVAASTVSYTVNGIYHTIECTYN